MRLSVIGRNYRLSAEVDDEDYRTLDLGSYKWHRLIGRNNKIYVRTEIKGKTIFLHRLIMGLVDAPRSVYVDHIDHNGLNNSRTNLRVADNRGNQRNSRKRLSAKNYSIYKGVSFRTGIITKPWTAHITLPDLKHGGKRKYLGYYRTEIEAAQAYNKAATELFGSYAHLNVIEPK